MNAHWAEQYANQHLAELRHEATGGQLVKAAGARAPRTEVTRRPRARPLGMLARLLPFARRWAR